MIIWQDSSRHENIMKRVHKNIGWNGNGLFSYERAVDCNETIVWLVSV